MDEETRDTLKILFALTPIGAVYNLFRIAREFETRGDIVAVARGWNPGENTDDAGLWKRVLGDTGAVDYVRVIRPAR